jgi:hypothetical protein
MAFLTGSCSIKNDIMEVLISFTVNRNDENKCTGCVVNEKENEKNVILVRKPEGKCGVLYKVKELAPKACISVRLFIFLDATARVLVESGLLEEFLYQTVSHNVIITTTMRTSDFLCVVLLIFQSAGTMSFVAHCE